MPREDAEQRDPGSQEDERGERRRGGRRTQERTSEEHRTEPSDGRGRRQAEGHREGERRTQRQTETASEEHAKGRRERTRGGKAPRGTPCSYTTQWHTNKQCPPAPGERGGSEPSRDLADSAQDHLSTTRLQHRAVLLPGKPDCPSALSLVDLRSPGTNKRHGLVSRTTASLEDQ